MTSDPPSDLVDYDAIPVDPPANTTEATPPSKLVPKAKRTTDMKSKKNTKKRPEDQLHSDAVNKENVTSISVKPTVKPETRSAKSEKRVDEAGVAKATPASRDGTIIAARAKVSDTSLCPQSVLMISRMSRSRSRRKRLSNKMIWPIRVLSTRLQKRR